MSGPPRQIECCTKCCGTTVPKEGLNGPEGCWRGGPDTALSVWVAEQQEATEETLAFQTILFLRHPDIALSIWVAEQLEATEDTLAFPPLLFLRHPDIQSDVWATPPDLPHLCWNLNHAWFRTKDNWPYLLGWLSSGICLGIIHTIPVKRLIDLGSDCVLAGRLRDRDT